MHQQEPKEISHTLFPATLWIGNAASELCNSATNIPRDLKKTSFGLPYHENRWKVQQSGIAELLWLWHYGIFFSFFTADVPKKVQVCEACKSLNTVREICHSVQWVWVNVACLLKSEYALSSGTERSVQTHSNVIMEKEGNYINICSELMQRL